MSANDRAVSALDPSVDPTYACITYANTVMAYASTDGSAQICVDNGSSVIKPWGGFTYLTGYPAMAVFNGVLHMTHQSGLGDHQLFWMTSSDWDHAKEWSYDLAIAASLNGSPGMAVFNKNLYVAHQGSDTTNEAHRLWYITYDGSAWAADKNIPGVKMNGSPSLAVFDNTLYIFHQGSDTTGEAHALWYTTTTDGITWTPDTYIPGVSMDNSPSACATSEALFVAYKNAGTGDILFVLKGSHDSEWSSPYTIEQVPPICDRASPTLYGDPGQPPDQVMLLYRDPDGGEFSTWPFIGG